ncbi:MAG TPA: DMT family transporter [Amycolatopsis sp.]|uniref:DMT family transporter n=1 Tax=Amycolatopsis nalaikhensis TaxID=715472 RepID=A0ABY8XK08_9PSEU|nr:DMT family transporter [Amycolatopsis sp. 2-2]WIV55939.1 DMT family transporter [Amycolatopsis sp. 2-2]
MPAETTHRGRTKPATPWPSILSSPWAMAAGALGVSTSAVLIGISGASPGTATFYRCALAAVMLVPLVIFEWRREGTPTNRQRGYALAAGTLFAGDALWWTQAIGEVGAGLSTVLVNAQVVIVPLLALVVDREPVSRRFLAILPVMIIGIVLTGGVLEQGAGGRDPLAGTVHALLAAACYSGFLFLLRRGGSGGRTVQSYQYVVASAALVALGAGFLWNGMTLAPGWAQLGWLVLVAFGGQVAGWLLVALATPRLAGEVGAALLMLTPIGALALGAVLLGERPSPWQITGSAAILAGACFISRKPSGSGGRQRP